MENLEPESLFLEVTPEMLDHAHLGSLDFEAIMNLAEITLDTGGITPGLYHYRLTKDGFMSWEKV